VAAEVVTRNLGARTDAIVTMVPDRTRSIRSIDRNSTFLITQKARRAPQQPARTQHNLRFRPEGMTYPLPASSGPGTESFCIQRPGGLTHPLPGSSGPGTESLCIQRPGGSTHQSQTYRRSHSTSCFIKSQGLVLKQLADMLHHLSRHQPTRANLSADPEVADVCSPAMHYAMPNKWLKELGLLSFKQLWCDLATP
jgi:hypothetical protein